MDVVKWVLVTIAAGVVAWGTEKIIERWVAPRVKSLWVRYSDRRLAKDKALSTEMELAAIDSHFAIALFARLTARMMFIALAFFLAIIGLLLGLLLSTRFSGAWMTAYMVLFLLYATWSFSRVGTNFSRIGAVARGVMRLRTDAREQLPSGEEPSQDPDDPAPVETRRPIDLQREWARNNPRWPTRARLPLDADQEQQDLWADRDYE